jgi:hypothetical protein
MITRPAIFKWRQAESGLIRCAARWYLRYSLSLRDVEELLEERGLHVDHTTVWRRVQCYGPELEQRLRWHLNSTSNPGEWMKPTTVFCRLPEGRPDDRKEGEPTTLPSGKGAGLAVFPLASRMSDPPQPINTSAAITHPPSSNSFCNRWNFCCVFS